MTPTPLTLLAEQPSATTTLRVLDDSDTENAETISGGGRARGDADPHADRHHSGQRPAGDDPAHLGPRRAESGRGGRGRVFHRDADGRHGPQHQFDGGGPRDRDREPAGGHAAHDGDLRA